MLKCQRAAELISLQHDRPLSLWERWQLRLHPAGLLTLQTTTKNNWTLLVWQCNMYGGSRLKISSERLPEKIFDEIICSLINKNILLKRLDSDWNNWCNSELQKWPDSSVGRATD